MAVGGCGLLPWALLALLCASCAAVGAQLNSGAPEGFRLQWARPMTPVYKFWRQGHPAYTVHLGEPEEGEHQDSVVFYAYHEPVEGAEPVHSFWDSRLEESSLHFGEARKDEAGGKLQFYAFREQNAAQTLQPVHAFWNGELGHHTLHPGEAQAGEVLARTEFYAFAPPTAEALYECVEEWGCELGSYMKGLHWRSHKAAGRLFECQAHCSSSLDCAGVQWNEASSTCVVWRGGNCNVLLTGANEGWTSMQGWSTCAKLRPEVAPATAKLPATPPPITTLPATPPPTTTLPATLPPTTTTATATQTTTSRTATQTTTSRTTTPPPTAAPPTTTPPPAGSGSARGAREVHFCEGMPGYPVCAGGEEIAVLSANLSCCQDPWACPLSKAASCARDEWAVFQDVTRDVRAECDGRGRCGLCVKGGCSGGLAQIVPDQQCADQYMAAHVSYTCKTASGAGSSTSSAPSTSSTSHVEPVAPSQELDPNMMLAPEASDHCAAGYEGLTDINACMGYAMDRCEAGFVRSGLWLTSPAGCFVHEQQDYTHCSVSFNAYKVLPGISAVERSQWKVCVREMTPFQQKAVSGSLLREREHAGLLVLAATTASIALAAAGLLLFYRIASVPRPQEDRMRRLRRGSTELRQPYDEIHLLQL